MFTWHFEERPSINGVMSDCWIRPQFPQHQQQQQPSPTLPSDALIPTPASGPGSTPAVAGERIVHDTASTRLAIPREPPPAGIAVIDASAPAGTSSPAVITSPRRTPIRRDHWTAMFPTRPGAVQASLPQADHRYSQAVTAGPTGGAQPWPSLVSSLCPVSTAPGPVSGVSLTGPSPAVMGSNVRYPIEPPRKYSSRAGASPRQAL